MKKFIIKELRSVGKFQMDESIQGSMPSGFTYAIQNGFEKWAQTKDKGTLANVNDATIELIVSKFDGEFAEYLRTYLKKYGKSSFLGFKYKGKGFSYVEILGILSRYLENPTDVNNYENVFELIGIPMIQYYLSKTFGKDSLLSGLKQITPFMQKVSTGNGALDTRIYRALENAIKSPNVRGFLSTQMNTFITPRIANIALDQEYKDLFNEGLRRFIQRNFYGNEAATKMEMISQVIRFLPWLKGSLRKKIRENLTKQLTYEDLMRLGFNPNNRVPNAAIVDKAAELASIPILQHIVDSSKEIYFKDAGFDALNQIVENVFKSPMVASIVKTYVKEFMKDGVTKAVELQRKKEEAKRNRKSRRR
jgi:hypothetical protein